MVGFWVLKKYVMYLAIWGKACKLMFSVDPQCQCSISNCIKSPIRINLLFSCSVMSSSFATPWTAAHQAPLSIRFSSQGYWSGLPFPSQGDLPNPGTEPTSPAWQADSLPVSRLGSPFKSITQLQNPEERSTIHS